MQKRNLRVLFAISLALIASACGTVRITDQEWCGDMGPSGASCFHTLSDQTRDIDKEQWDEERFGQICGQASAYVEFKNALLKLCADTGRCSWQVENQIRNFGNKVYRQNIRQERVRYEHSVQN